MSWKEVLKAKVGSYPTVLEGNQMSETLRDEFQRTQSIQHKYRDSQTKDLFTYGEKNPKHRKAVAQARKLISELMRLDPSATDEAERIDSQLTELLENMKEEYNAQLPSIFDM